MLKFIILLFATACFGQSCAQNSEYNEVIKSQIVGGKKNSEWAISQSYVVLISIDGFRYDYAEKYGAKNILKFMESGVTTSEMIPSFPTKTFPNHYTLITGLYPINHGIIGNEFYSRDRNAWYKIKDKSSKDGGWYGGKPLWVLAEEAGMLSASFFWIGSEASIHNTYSNYYYPYKSSVSNVFRFAQILDWLKLEEDSRPHFINAYFSMVDDAGHNFGPDSDQTRETVLKMDSLFGEFINNLKEVDLPVNVVLVSDHGMSAIKYGVVLSEIVDLAGCEISTSFPPMIYCDDSSRILEIESALIKDGRVQVYRPDKLPNNLHMSSNERIGDLILYTEAPTVVLEKPKPVRGGTHGFDPYQNREMRSIFAASGPLFKEGYVVDPFENIHVYPLIAEILGLEVTDSIDGDLKVLQEILLESNEN